MEDYKKKYEEAIFRMNKWVEGSEIIDPKEVAEFVFPELKESEDNRIKTNIIKLLRFVRDTNHQYSDACNKAIDWLEKQSKQKTEIKYIYPKFQVGDVIEPVKPNGYTPPVRVKYIGEGNYSCESDDCKSFLSFPICKENEYVLTEQEPTWSEEDEKMCQETIDWFEKKCFPYALEHENPAIKSIKWLKSLKERMKGE